MSKKTNTEKQLAKRTPMKPARKPRGRLNAPLVFPAFFGFGDYLRAFAPPPRPEPEWVCAPCGISLVSNPLSPPLIDPTYCPRCRAQMRRPGDLETGVINAEFVPADHRGIESPAKQLEPPCLQKP